MRILIAEDMPTTALQLRQQLERAGNRVEVAHDGESAWSALRGGDHRLVIADWVMPLLDGPDLCRRIRSHPDGQYVYFILLSSRDSREDRIEGLRAGADDFLTKPVDPDELCLRLEVAQRILAVHEELARRNTLLTRLAATDPLTGVKNRRRFAEDLEWHARLLPRQSHPLSLLMLDVDRFKTYNDTHGHLAGDEVLRGLAELLRFEVRESDAVARYGGEEFAILLPATDLDGATELAERIRAAVEARDWPLTPVTASLGVAAAPPGLICEPADLIARADAALYQAKRSGRNRVAVDHDHDHAPAPAEPASLSRVPRWP